MTTITVRAICQADQDAVFALHAAAAAVAGSGLARQKDEIALGYVQRLIADSVSHGLILGAFEDDRLVGEIHVVRPEPRQFSHVLTGLTIVVMPDVQGKGVGTLLFGALRDHLARACPRPTRVELVARSGNERAIRLYERLGFEVEGRFVGRVRLPDGTFEDDIPMALHL